MPLYHKCAYKDCNRTPKPCSELSFHRFPSDEVSQARWIELVGVPKLAELRPRQLLEKRICSEHFKESDFINYDRTRGRRKLKCNAVPISSALASQISVSAAQQNSTATNNQTLNSGNIKIFNTANNQISSTVGKKILITVNKQILNSMNKQILGTTNKQILGTASKQITNNSGNLITNVVARQIPIKLEPIDPSDAIVNEICVETSESPPVAPTNFRSNNNIRLCTPPPSLTKYPQVTFRELKLLKKNATLQLKLKKARQTIRNISRRTPVRPTIPKIIESVSNHIDGEPLLLLSMQLNHLKHAQWNDEEKQFALELYNKSSDCYMFLKDVKKFTLPCETLIRRWNHERVAKSSE